jgi:hypothetical protein
VSPNTLRLLGIVAALLLVQWVVVPWLDWQGEQVAELERDGQKLANRAAVIDELDDLSLQKQRLSELLSGLSSLAVPNMGGIELSLQQLTTAQLADYDLDVEAFEWSEAASGDVMALRARITIAGPTPNFIDWQNSLLDSEPWVVIEEFELRRLDSRFYEMNNISGDILIRFIAAVEQ